MWQIDEDEREYSEHESKQEKVEDKKGFFDSILDKFKKKADKKEVRLTLSAESEPKRRQWIFSLNYYKSSDSSKVLFSSTLSLVKQIFSLWQYLQLDPYSIPILPNSHEVFLPQVLCP